LLQDCFDIRSTIHFLFFSFFESFLSGILSTPLDFGNKESGSSYSQARQKPLII